MIVVAPADLGIQLPEDGEVVDAVLLLKGRDSLVGTANAALPDLVQKLVLALVLRPLPYGLEAVKNFVLWGTDIYMFFSDHTFA